MSICRTFEIDLQITGGRLPPRIQTIQTESAGRASLAVVVGELQFNNFHLFYLQLSHGPDACFRRVGSEKFPIALSPCVSFEQHIHVDEHYPVELNIPE